MAKVKRKSIFSAERDSAPQASVQSREDVHDRQLEGEHYDRAFLPILKSDLITVFAILVFIFIAFGAMWFFDNKNSWIGTISEKLAKSMIRGF